MKHLPREHQRVFLSFYLRVFEGKKFIGFLTDISRGGMMVMSEFQLDAGKDYSFKMNLPSSLEWKGKNDRDKEVKLKVRCEWSKHYDVEKEFYISGFKFMEIHENDNKIIHEIIKAYRLR